MLANERKVSLSQAAKSTPGRPNVSTLWRWCRKGHRGIRLEYARYGRRIFTSIEAVERFARAVAATDPASVTSPESLPMRGSLSGTEDQAKSERVLRRAGI